MKGFFLFVSAVLDEVVKSFVPSKSLLALDKKFKLPPEADDGKFWVVKGLLEFVN
jgi:hypothetical protein